MEIFSLSILLLVKLYEENSDIDIDFTYDQSAAEFNVINLNISAENSTFSNGLFAKKNCLKLLSVAESKLYKRRRNFSFFVWHLLALSDWHLNRKF